MNCEPTAKQVEFYRDNGFVAIEGFLSADELEVWRRVTDEAVAHRLGDQDTWHNQRDGRASLRNASAWPTRTRPCAS